MKRAKHRLPIPQDEFGFGPDTFRLFHELTADGERLEREKAEADAARANAEKAQSPLFPPKR